MISGATGAIAGVFAALAIAHGMEYVFAAVIVSLVSSNCNIYNKTGYSNESN